MCTALEKNLNYSDLSYYPEIHEIKSINNVIPFLSPLVSKNITEFNNFVSFVSTKQKVFITLDPNFGHFHNDSLGIIFGYLEILKNCLFVFDISKIDNLESCTFYKFLLKVLDDLKISYETIKFDNNKVIHANNFFIVKSLPFGHINSPEIIFNIYKKYVKNINSLPYKNVYLSRKNNNRIQNEDILIEYFKNKNYEIVYSENFLNFQDQINYFYEVKTLISVSGAGLCNAIFMQPETNMVEILTPFNLNSISLSDGQLSEKPIKQIHYISHLVSFFKNQNYLSIKNNNVDDIINKLEKVQKIL